MVAVTVMPMTVTVMAPAHLVGSDPLGFFRRGDRVLGVAIA